MDKEQAPLQTSLGEQLWLFVLMLLFLSSGYDKPSEGPTVTKMKRLSALQTRLCATLDQGDYYLF